MSGLPAHRSFGSQSSSGHLAPGAGSTRRMAWTQAAEHTFGGDALSNRPTELLWPLVPCSGVGA